VFCHNDLHITNLPVKIMGRDLRLSGILDFDGALAGDPLMDVAKALHYVGAEAKAALLKGYEDRREQSLYCAVFEGKLPSMGSAGPWQEWRNKAIAPYGPAPRRCRSDMIGPGLWPAQRRE
jgi:aminoglycoside phosphotransferase (APT) family kinase protein